MSTTAAVSSLQHASSSRIAIFRALQLGDLLCAVPALRALRAAFPRAHVTLVGLPWASAFVERYATLVDELLVFPGMVGFPEQRETNDGLPAFFAEARAHRFDLALQMHGSGRCANDVVLGLGARMNAGFVEPGEQRDGIFIPWPERVREPERYLLLMRALGVPASDVSLSFPLTDGDRLAADAIAARHELSLSQTVIVHAGSQWPSRRWPAERFAAVADALAADGCDIALTGTTGERDVTSAVARAMRVDVQDLTGETTLGALAALVARVPLVVCNDTGLSHVAAALRTPSVVVACGSDTARWAPADSVRHRVLADYPSCRPCAFRDCPVGHVCARNVAVDDVVAAARAQLALARRMDDVARIDRGRGGAGDIAALTS